MDTAPLHLLSLKVMRVSRPELASAWQPFYSSSPSFSAHSTASIASLQGASPIPGHPKTLRDLTNASELLTLPSAFGSIQLGETFTSCLCVNNEAQLDIDSVSMKVEMQTTTSKIMLAEVGGPEHKLLVGDTMEHIITHEIKELGQHVLACSVTYKLPSNARSPNLPNGDIESNNGLQTVRKFYKFAVTNPLSVKTKVHTPRSPTALMLPAERDKIFLEVHIQNLTQESIHFERMKFECVEGWEVIDTNFDAMNELVSLFSGSTALMQPQDTRQYIYILSPKSVSLVPIAYAPGSVIPLGRLDIAWKSPFGEPGRLLTSILSRRIPLPPASVQSPPSALPSYLKRSLIGTPPSRPQSPHAIPSRPGTPPPLRPDSPPRNRSSSVGPARPQSPFQVQSSASAAQAPIEVNLIIRANPPTPIKLLKPFTIPFSIVLSVPSPPGKRQRRVARVAIQHIQLLCKGSLAPPPFPPQPEGAFSPRLPSSGFSTPSSNAPPTFNYALAHQKILMASPRQAHKEILEQDRGEFDNDNMALPPPVFNSNQFDAGRAPRPSSNKFIGSSMVLLPPVELIPAGQVTHDYTIEPSSKLYAVQNFDLSYLPTQTGYTVVGGLRVLLLDDKILDEDELWDDSSTVDPDRASVRARVLQELEVIAEVWVSL
ncbi:hypothetical protein BDZ94DRAFT_1291642 [Collybia nuda]|uniref:DUF974-domain-containing protein n=1 Tax=Collybia nuda TaxID=64659 RepID=A0A9P5XXC7_9AGAR|nr:hypothetical protein BDZ94DRAFT_1291642 [Collybia nuda]